MPNIDKLIRLTVRSDLSALRNRDDLFPLLVDFVAAYDAWFKGKGEEEKVFWPALMKSRKTIEDAE